MTFYKLSTLHIFSIILLTSILSGTGYLSYSQLTASSDDVELPNDSGNEDSQPEEENKTEETKDYKIAWGDLSFVIYKGHMSSSSSSQIFNHLHIQMEIHTPPPEESNS